MAAGVEHADLSLETMHRAVYQRLAELHAGVVEQVARREVVGAVDDDIDAVQQAFDIAAGDALGDGLDAGARIERASASPAAESTFGIADARVGVQDLPLQVAAVDDVVVGDAQACPTPAAAR